MKAPAAFETDGAFASRLRLLHRARRNQKLQVRGQVSRRGLSRAERDHIFAKTAGRCHVCGGPIEGPWQADHVFSHSLGGKHAADNYLPAHAICNNYRWFYGAEEFQWILKLGVWLRTQIERGTKLGRMAAKAFCAYERRRAGRRVDDQGEVRGEQ